MKGRRYSTLVGLIVLVFAAASCYVGDSTSSVEQRRHEQEPEARSSQAGLEVPFSIILNSEKSSPAGESREIYVLLKEPYFTEDNLRKVFLSLSTKYPTPRTLTITVYSDLEMVDRAIRNHLYPDTIVWSDTPEGEKAAEEWAQKRYPHKSGYFRAHYFRKGHEETATWSPDPQKEDHIVLDLKKVS